MNKVDLAIIALKGLFRRFERNSRMPQGSAASIRRRSGPFFWERLDDLRLTWCHLAGLRLAWVVEEELISVGIIDDQEPVAP
jgi:hypothetical protein